MTNNKNNMIDPDDVQKVIDRHSWADEDTDCKSVLDDVLRDLRNLLPRDYPEDMLGMWATHPGYGRVLVIRAKPDGEGEVAIAYRDDCARTGVWHTWVDPSTLSFPEQHPETLTTLEDYANAPEGTIVAEDNGAPLIQDDWRIWCAAGHPKEYAATELAGTTRRVLRWGWGK